MGVSPRDLINKTKSPERVMRICLDGQVRTQLDEVQAALDEARKADTAKMAKSQEVVDLEAQLEELEQAVEEASHPFRFRGISHWRRREIERQFPSEDEDVVWDVDAGAPTLIAECLVDPKFTPDEVRELLEKGNERLADEFITAALLVCQRGNEIPKSGRGSATTRRSASK